MTATTSIPFQNPGDVCLSCLPFWSFQKLPGKVMIAIAKETEHHHIPIHVCPFCDGQTILRLNGC